MDPTTQNIDKKKLANYEKTTSSIEALADKKILAFPSSLGSTTKDEAGNDYAYVNIRINTATEGSRLKEDASAGAVYTANGAVQTGALSDFGKVTWGDADKDMTSRFGADAVKKQNAIGWSKRVGLTKLDRAIVLPMPANYTVRTNVDYEDTTNGDLSQIGDAISALGSWKGAASLVGGALTGAAAAMGSGVINALKSKYNVDGKNGSADMQRKLLASARIATNPKKEILFKEIDFRKFNFEYILSPKNAMESATIQEIIRTLRYYSLPELIPGKFFYTFPGEFEIALMKGSTENPAMPRIGTCVLESVDINFSSGGAGWGNLPDGMTTEVSMSLQFKELEMIHRNRVWNKESVITSGY